MKDIVNSSEGFCTLFFCLSFFVTRIFFFSRSSYLTAIFETKGSNRS